MRAKTNRAMRKIVKGDMNDIARKRSGSAVQGVDLPYTANGQYGCEVHSPKIGTRRFTYV